MQKISDIVLGYLVNDHDAFEQDIYRYGIEFFLLNTINILSIFSNIHNI